MRYIVLSLYLALGACAEPTQTSPAPTGPRSVMPDEVVLIGGCEYYLFKNNHGDTYTPKMTPQVRSSSMLDAEISVQRPVVGYNNCPGK